MIDIPLQPIVSAEQCLAVVQSSQADLLIETEVLASFSIGAEPRIYLSRETRLRPAGKVDKRRCRA